MTDTVSYPDTIENHAAENATQRISLTAIIIIGVVLLIITGLGISLARVGQSQPKSGPAPVFTLRTFEGETFNLYEQRGKVVIVNFWASWCVPCRDEAPILQDVWERYKDRGVVLVGVAYLDIEGDALDFIDEFGITYPNGMDRGKVISERYKIEGVPETFIVDQTGEIIEFHAGPAQPGQLEAIIDELLAT